MLPGINTAFVLLLSADSAHWCTPTATGSVMSFAHWGALVHPRSNWRRPTVRRRSCARVRSVSDAAKHLFKDRLMARVHAHLRTLFRNGARPPGAWQGIGLLHRSPGAAPKDRLTAPRVTPTFYFLSATVRAPRAWQGIGLLHRSPWCCTQGPAHGARHAHLLLLPQRCAPPGHGRV